MHNWCSLAVVVVSAAGAAPAWAQSFVPVDQVPQRVRDLPKFVRPEVSQTYRIDWAQLDAELELARAAGRDGREGAMGPGPLAPVIALPAPDGSSRTYRVIEAPIMEPELAAKFPAFRTYRLLGVEDQSAVGRIDVTSQGLRGMIRTGSGMIFIDPYSGGDQEYISVYNLHDFNGAADWACHVGPQHAIVPAPAAGEPATPEGPGVPIRTYRMAMACSGEYGAYQATVQGRSPNAADAFAAIVTVTNRVNVTFEADIGVRFLLVANNNLLAFFDPATDPYPDADPTCTSNPAADCSGGYLNVNTGAINTVIGAANYDIGHVLTRVRGGVAYLRAACNANVKGGGVSGIPRGGEVEPASALVPMHELGHQFGANHTFNGVLGRCNANINGTTNWEPGGGSTLMAYPGACPVDGTIGVGDTDNLALFADPYFHTGSLIEMRSFLASASSNCSASLPTANPDTPVLAGVTTSGLSIPPSTPFTLSALAVDASPNVVFTWDELDVGPAQRLTGPTSVDNGSSALFRSFPPVSSGVRTIPRLPDLIAGVSYIGERMPTFTGVTRKFRVSVRDNQGASVSSGLVNVNIAATVPFVVSAPVGGQILRGPTIPVAWNAGAIAPAPISTTSVTVTLSLDGGLTFPYTLGAGLPNSGSAQVSVGNLVSEQARVKVAADGNIFFNISGVFALRPPCPSDYNRDGFLNLDDLGDFITDYYSAPPIPGGVQPAAPTFAGTSVGFGVPCPGARDAPAPYAPNAYRVNGFRVGFSADGSNACPLSPDQAFPNLDNLGDFITAYYAAGPTC
jgi:hypothetical protein